MPGTASFTFCPQRHKKCRHRGGTFCSSFSLLHIQRQSQIDQFLIHADFSVARRRTNSINIALLIEILIWYCAVFGLNLERLDIIGGYAEWHTIIGGLWKSNRRA